MNRKHLLPLALATALCHTPVVPVMAQTVILNPATTTADEFIQTYAGKMVETVSQGFYIRELSWFTYIDNTNAEIIATGRSVYDQMPLATQQAILNEYSLHGLNYILFSQSAIDYLTPVVNQQPAYDDPNAPILNLPSEQAPIQTPVETPSDPVISTPEENTDTPAPSETPVEGVTVVEEGTVGDNLQTENEIQPAIEDLSGRFHIEDGYLINSAIFGTLDPDQPVADPVIEVENETDEVTDEVETKEEEQVEVEPESTSRMDNTAQAFLNTYCVVNGSVIKQADSSNYNQILGGFSTWNSLTQAQRSSINSYLTAAGSSRYQVLYRQANQVRLNLPVSGTSKGSVSTSTQSDALLWFSAALISGAVAIVAIESNKKQKALDALKLG